MKFIRNFFDKQGKNFSKGGKLEKFSPLYEALDTFIFTPGTVTHHPSHIRDATDLKRVMITVVIAMLPAVFMGLYNVGYQANLVFSKLGEVPIQGWRLVLLSWLGIPFDPQSIFANLMLGTLYFLPVYIVTLAVGGFWEVLFAIIRKHEVTEGFLVTSLLFALILPPTIPLWQVAVGISFGIVLGKEVFGGVGMNILNPALTGRVFLFFAYPAEISGDAVWIAVDGVSKATPLAELSSSATQISSTWMDAFLGFIPGSMGETSALACIIGAIILIITGIGSWKIMVSILAGMVSLSLFFNLVVTNNTNPMFSISPQWHLVLGGFAFGAVFMATDPVSAAMTEKGKYIYGFLIGILVVLIRVINPAFPEGMMLAILFGNVFAPIIDRIFINANIKRRMIRYGN
jgi:Na+-transporting NADH:ubiquinone oxidoreductase subunit B